MTSNAITPEYQRTIDLLIVAETQVHSLVKQNAMVQADGMNKDRIIVALRGEMEKMRVRIAELEAAAASPQSPNIGAETDAPNGHAAH